MQRFRLNKISGNLIKFCKHSIFYYISLFLKKRDLQNNSINIILKNACKDRTTFNKINKFKVSLRSLAFMKRFLLDLLMIINLRVIYLYQQEIQINILIEMSCCGSKKKVPPQQPKIGQMGQSQGEVNYTRESAKIQIYQPKSRVSFLANDYDPKPFSANETFVNTRKAEHFVKDRPDRLEDYARESRVASQSKLLDSKDILNYDLDDLEGVSKNYSVDTFHYESVLTHYFIHTNKDKIFDKNSQTYAIYEEPVYRGDDQIKSTKYF